MADSALAKNFEFKIQSEFAGYNSSRDKTNIAENVLVRGSQNVYKKLSGTIAVRPGQKRYGPIDTSFSAVSSEFVWNTSWGTIYPLLITDGELRVLFENVYYTLLSGLTSTRYVFDKWWDNTEKKDRVLFVHGNSDIQHWSGGLTAVAAQIIGGATLTKSGSTTWQQAGFATNTVGEKKFFINGSVTEYTYTGGESTTTLTGITPALPALAGGEIVLQSVITTTNKPAASFTNDFIKVINNQLYVGSYTSRLCYISKNTDFTDFVVPTPRAPGDPELLTLDGTLKGIGVRQGKAHIGFGSGSWAVVSFENITVGTDLTQQTNVDVKPVATLQAPYAHEFIDTVGDSLVYLAQDQQVRTFGDFTNLFTPGYPSLSQEINTELEEQNFTGGSLRCIGEFTYLCAPTIGSVWLYQVRQSVDQIGQVVAERLWHSPFIWNITSVNEISGTIVGFSNANPQIYELWDTNQWYDDSPSEEHLPYSCVAAFAYRTGNRRQGLLTFDKIFTEGYISEGTPLSVRINYNYQGALAVLIGIINSIEEPAYLFSGSSAPSLGDHSLGEEPLGDGFTILTPQDTLPKFKVIKSMNLQNCFEYQPVYYSDEVNARWEILAVGTNAIVEAEQNATFIINKRRT